MTNGTCMLVTWEWGGGSGVFSDILLVRFREGREDRHLLMYVVRREGLGGRGHVTVYPESVEVAAASNVHREWPHLTIREIECHGVLDP